MPRSSAAVQTELDTWYAARAAIAAGQSYSINGRTLSLPQLDQVNKTIGRLERELATAQAITDGRNPIFQRSQLGGMGY